MILIIAIRISNNNDNKSHKDNVANSVQTGNEDEDNKDGGDNNEAVVDRWLMLMLMIVGSDYVDGSVKVLLLLLCWSGSESAP